MTNFSNETIYHCPDNIKNFKISVTFNGETRYFQWQQKVYSKFERDFYKNEKNCLTDLEHKYHKDVVKLVENDSVLFSYIDEDHFIPPNEILSRPISICGLFEGKSFRNNADLWDQYEVMYIMVDLGEYLDDVWIKNEHVLCTIKYECERRILFMNPDFSSTKPYTLEINDDDSIKTYSYTIENACEVIEEEYLRKEEELTEKLIAEKIKLHTEIVGEYFEKPLKTVVHLFFEIAKASNFENDNIYIRYLIDLPEDFLCEDTTTLTGTTQTSRTSPNHFGFCFEVVLQVEKDDFVQRLPYIYFEVISKDTWSRFRTEGLAYQCLPVFKSGYCEFQLSCVRICPEGTSGELRRFFIGDCGCYNDITWVGLPKDYEGNAINKFGVKTVSSGELLVKLNVIQQKSFINGDVSPKTDFLLEKFQSSGLLKSVTEVIKAFKKARKIMIEARKNV